jgi:hypothetical protein
VVASIDSTSPAPPSSIRADRPARFIVFGAETDTVDRVHLLSLAAPFPDLDCPIVQASADYLLAESPGGPLGACNVTIAVGGVDVDTLPAGLLLGTYAQRVVPDTVAAGSATPFRVLGGGLTGIDRVTLRAAATVATFDCSNVAVIDDNTLTATAPPTADVGAYVVTLYAAGRQVGTCDDQLDVALAVPPVGDWPTLEEVRSFLRLQPDPAADPIIDGARLAAVDYGQRRTSHRYDVIEVPYVVHQAALMHSARLYRRRDTVDGTIGFGDLGAIRVGRVDPDIEALYSSVGPVVFG